MRSAPAMASASSPTAVPSMARTPASTWAATRAAGPGMSAGGAASTPGRAAGQQTDIYRFDITSPGPPRFAGGGSVPGYLIDQYALSEWQGYLRVATTTGTSWARADGAPADAQTSSSAVY